jgi:peptidoglycan hydrolase-like protein with peptidoglycan-binding domain
VSITDLRSRVYADLRSWRQDGDENTGDLHEILAWRIWQMRQSYWFDIASATRTYAQQRYLYDLWQAGQYPHVVGNPDGPTATTPEGDRVVLTANHMAGSDGKGRAIDISVTSWLGHESAYGLVRTVASELWHLSPFWSASDGYLPGPWPPPGFRPLRFRSIGGDVAALQHQLGLTVDSSYGPQTDQAVRTYQRRHGLTVDGVWGPRCQDRYDQGGLIVIPTVDDMIADAEQLVTQARRLARAAKLANSGNPRREQALADALTALTAARVALDAAEDA